MICKLSSVVFHGKWCAVAIQIAVTFELERVSSAESSH